MACIDPFDLAGEGRHAPVCGRGMNEHCRALPGGVARAMGISQLRVLMHDARLSFSMQER